MCPVCVEGVNQLQQRASKPPQQSTSGSGVKDHGSEAHGAAGDWPTLSPTPTLETRKPVEVGVIVPDRDSRVGGGDVKSQVAASDPAFDRFESLDISSTEGEAVKFSDSEEDTTSEPVVIQPLTR